jgi:hypothetical protein
MVWDELLSLDWVYGAHGREFRAISLLHRGPIYPLRLLGVNRGLNAKTFDHVRQGQEPRVSSTFSPCCSASTRQSNRKITHTRTGGQAAGPLGGTAAISLMRMVSDRSFLSVATKKRSKGKTQRARPGRDLYRISEDNQWIPVLMHRGVISCRRTITCASDFICLKRRSGRKSPDWYIGKPCSRRSIRSSAHKQGWQSQGTGIP